MKISTQSGDSGLLLVSAIEKNTISMYYAHLRNINFDESIDMLPTSNKDERQDAVPKNNRDNNVDMQNEASNFDDGPSGVSRMTYI